MADPGQFFSRYGEQFARGQRAEGADGEPVATFRVVVSSADGQIAVTVDDSGHLVDLKLGESLRHHDGAAVAAEVLRLLQAVRATSDVVPERAKPSAQARAEAERFSGQVLEPAAEPAVEPARGPAVEPVRGRAPAPAPEPPADPFRDGDHPRPAGHLRPADPPRTGGHLRPVEQPLPVEPARPGGHHRPADPHRQAEPRHTEPRRPEPRREPRAAEDGAPRMPLFPPPATPRRNP
ncbi:hypothetical protein [Actinosynnema pretiosum]|uniref:YbaB/EbfC DNA-binding family protein n=1 Tax=Actinosynnema pretiosum TaxID=42197 RepID=A0A290Z9A3_9PSEU|nr:hypothetical protein [Actinosynnema pretiosum]ATE55549.1 hypothetical protein CNX65_21530 [Actinosynnema pretiosum]